MTILISCQGQRPRIAFERVHEAARLGGLHSLDTLHAPQILFQSSLFGRLGVWTSFHWLLCRNHRSCLTITGLGDIASAYCTVASHCYEIDSTEADRVAAVCSHASNVRYPLDV